MGIVADVLEVHGASIFRVRVEWVNVSVLVQQNHANSAQENVRNSFLMATKCTGGLTPVWGGS